LNLAVIDGITLVRSGSYGLAEKRSWEHGVQRGTAGFHGLGRRAVVVEFNGGRISSDGGGLLLREPEQRSPILKQHESCFTDHQDADSVC
jgi:hypothetical protein